MLRSKQQCVFVASIDFMLLIFVFDDEVMNKCAEKYDKA